MALALIPRLIWMNFFLSFKKKLWINFFWCPILKAFSMDQLDRSNIIKDSLCEINWIKLMIKEQLLRPIRFTRITSYKTLKTSFLNIFSLIFRNEQFLLFPQCFLPVWITCCHFRQIWNCRLQILSEESKICRLETGLSEVRIVWRGVQDFQALKNSQCDPLGKNIVQSLGKN